MDEKEKEIFHTFMKKLDIINNSGHHFRLWLTNEQVYNTQDKNDDQIEFNDANMIDLLPGTQF